MSPYAVVLMATHALQLGASEADESFATGGRGAGIGAFDFSSIEEMDPSLGTCSLSAVVLYCCLCSGPPRSASACRTLVSTNRGCGSNGYLTCVLVSASTAEGYHVLYDRECPFELRLQVCVPQLS